MPSDNHLCGAFQGREAVGVAEVFRVVVSLAGFFFAADEGPNFIGLHVRYWQVIDSDFKEALASLADPHQKRHDRVSIDAG